MYAVESEELWRSRQQQKERKVVEKEGRLKAAKSHQYLVLHVPESIFYVLLQKQAHKPLTKLPEFLHFLDAMVSPSSYPCDSESVSRWVSQ